eukprot:1416395-Prymnesium_polylepis.1
MFERSQVPPNGKSSPEKSHSRVRRVRRIPSRKAQTTVEEPAQCGQPNDRSKADIIVAPASVAAEATNGDDGPPTNDDALAV